MSEELEKDVTAVEETTAQETKPMSFEDGVIKVDLSELNKPAEDAIPEQEADAGDVPVEQSQDTPSSEEVVEEVREPVQNDEQPIQVEESVLQEITEEKVQEQVEDLQDDIQEAIAEQQDSGVELPENIQKVVNFINETGGSLEDYVKLNTDYASLNETQLLREYYETTRPHLDSEEISFLISSLELEKLLLILSRLFISSDNFETSSELSLLDDDTL